jgi:hypothetical protein
MNGVIFASAARKKSPRSILKISLRRGGEIRRRHSPKEEAGMGFWTVPVSQLCINNTKFHNRGLWLKVMLASDNNHQKV